MRAPISWLREHAEVPDQVSPRELAAALIGVGMEVETVDVVGEGVSGLLVLGRVREVTELTEFRKPIRYCQVDVGTAQGGVRGIICGASNFAVDDLVVVALPGTVLPGDFEITARKTYGHISDGMICSAAELGLGEDSDGIMVLPDDTGVPGDDAAAALGLGEAVLDIAVTPDRGYCLSIRGLARETAIALGGTFTDPAMRSRYGYPHPDAPAPRVTVEDSDACTEFTAVRISGFDPSAPTPQWMQRRLVAAGMRSVSAAVDVTNYVMIELGQPLHAFDADAVAGGITVRHPHPGETLETLDHVVRELHRDDLLIADDDGPIGLAGVMGGLMSEITDATTAIILEAAHFTPEVVARIARRHKLGSEASRRFERGVDPALPWIASRRAAELLVAIGGGTVEGGTGIGGPPAATDVVIDPELPARVAGASISVDQARGFLHAVGCEVADEGADQWRVTAPSWRPDLRDPADLVEEVVRLYGYEKLPATLPTPPAGQGLTLQQRRRRAVSRALAGAGFVEALTYPFVGRGELAPLGLADTAAVRLANPLSDEQNLLRISLLPGLLTTARRNLSRGSDGVALFELGLVFLPGEPADVVRPGVSGPPDAEALADLAALLPDQPWHAAVVCAGQLERTGWWGGGRAAAWFDAVTAMRTVARAAGAQLEVRAAASEVTGWHPGRCAELVVDGEVVGHAGELHPRVVEALGLPPRASAAEIDLEAVIAAGVAVVAAPAVSPFPVAKEDVALTVAEEVTAAQVRQALVRGGGGVLESVRQFDEYRGSQLPPGTKSLAFALRFRAPDRTLSDADVAAARDAAVAAAVADVGAVLRSG